MAEGGEDGVEPKSNALLSAHQKQAVWAFRRFRFTFPDIEATFYQSGWTSTVWLKGCDAKRFNELKAYFDQRIRPATIRIDIVDAEPQGQTIVLGGDNSFTDFWLHGVPLNISDMNTLLAIGAADLPQGDTDFDHKSKKWVFRSPEPLSRDARAQVEMQMLKIGLDGDIEFKTLAPVPESERKTESFSNSEEGLNLTPASRIRGSSSSLKRLIAKDEDEWLNFIRRRDAAGLFKVVETATPPETFGCLFSATGSGETKLSELLTLFDRIDLMPSWPEPDWLQRLEMSEGIVQELVSMGRLRLVLPYSAETYMQPKLLEAVNEVNPDAIILSRRLATRTIEQGQHKHPLLYAPMNTRKRVELLTALRRAASNQEWAKSLELYGRIYDRQHYNFAFQGALAAMSCGVGSYLGELYHSVRKIDARLELGTTGAAVEWALGLGSTYIPRDFGGYEETLNAQIVASYLNRVPVRYIGPFRNRMETVVSGLLAVSGIPLMDVARNFRSGQVSRFRGVATKMMSAPITTEELRASVDELNAQVSAFESKQRFIKKYHIDHIPGELAGFGIGQVLDNWIPGSSVAANMFLKYVVARLPEKVQGPLNELVPMLTGLCTGSSVDAVIISRSKEALGGKPQK